MSDAFNDWVILWLLSLLDKNVCSVALLFIPVLHVFISNARIVFYNVCELFVLVVEILLVFRFVSSMSSSCYISSLYLVFLLHLAYCYNQLQATLTLPSACLPLLQHVYYFQYYLQSSIHHFISFSITNSIVSICYYIFCDVSVNFV